MRAVLIALLLTFATQAGADCGKLCDEVWWEKATRVDLRYELNAGADVMARSNDGKTPLMLAAFFGTASDIQALLNWGADVMAQSNDGTTPLLLAALNGTTENIQALLNAGADVTV